MNAYLRLWLVLSYESQPSQTHCCRSLLVRHWCGFESLVGFCCRNQEKSRVRKETYLIKSWSNCDHASLAVLPEIIIRTSIDCLDLPRNAIVLQLSWFPDPSPNTVFSTESFIYQCLFIHWKLHLFHIHLFMDFVLNMLQWGFKIVSRCLFIHQHHNILHVRF